MKATRWTTDRRLQELTLGVWDYPNPTPAGVVASLAEEILELRAENERLRNELSAGEVEIDLQKKGTE